LGIGEKAGSFVATTPLLGNLPELDSMAVLQVIVALEKHFDVTIHDDEITAEAFETVGSLAEFVRARLRAQQDGVSSAQSA
jgi:acyl carrier protein